MGGVNAAIEVGKHELKVCLGSEGELFSEPNQPRAINRIIKRLSAAGCLEYQKSWKCRPRHPRPAQGYG